ncbi:E3 ubiquitin-protein ligase UHRF1-like [Battus philenor]|uniref:E3 ubiquitin-protein ligase UHRF1-like n=1 Tax=Battus philenor TaxID=42288 RepID=UPI0035D116FF
MHVRVRINGKPDCIVVVESKLTKIEQLRKIIRQKFDVEPQMQRLFYGGKLLENGYTFHDYNIKLNDVIQLMVKLQPTDSTEKESKTDIVAVTKENTYEDAESDLYVVEDLVDVKLQHGGAWLEGKIVRIVYDPESINPLNLNDLSISSKENIEPSKGKRKIENTITNNKNNESKAVKKDFTEYFTHCTTEKVLPKHNATKKELLYKIQLDDDNVDSNLYCKESELRPRARTVIEINDLKIGEKVMVNYNPDYPLEKGEWYDFKVEGITKLRKNYMLVGTMYLGKDSVPQHDTKVKVHDKIFAIEEVIPVAQRSDKCHKAMKVQPEKRSRGINCRSCRDQETVPCGQCGCCVCLGKQNPEKIVLCDECDLGYHLECLQPPLVALPEDDWYCPKCVRDPAEVVAPGACKQPHKNVRTSRDWGRGMACVGKTKTCAMPLNHFGAIPGVEVGMRWRFRIQLSESGVHRPPVSGIHGRDVEGAYSIVLSGGYEDDVDNGYEFTYTGSGGRNLSGNKRTAQQSCDQTLTRQNKALARNCAAGPVSQKGGDAGAAWRDGRPVRVVRSYKMLRHFPKYAPSEGIRYDGIYKVVKYYQETGLSGFKVWKYLLRRDDPSPAPWEKDAKQYPIIYPDGYLEAEEEKNNLKEKHVKGIKHNKKRPLRDKNCSSQSEEEENPNKKLKIEESISVKPEEKNEDKPSAEENLKSKINTRVGRKQKNHLLSSEELKAITADSVNSKLWNEFFCNLEKKDFVEFVTETFLCIICQNIVVNPVTTECSHNFCLSCLKLAYQSNEADDFGEMACPCCRRQLPELSALRVNEQLRFALRTIMPGYDASKN